MVIYRPRYLYAKGAFREDWQMVVNPSGDILEVSAISAGGQFGSGTVVAFPDEAIVPGLCNVHSHAFQRALRGLTQTRGRKGQDNFWTWRENMYGIAANLTPEEVYTISTLAFLEMLASGITTVGEFHYLHHDPKGEPYGDPNELSLRVLQAASETGIRIVLLDTAYDRGGKGKNPNRAQKRFCDSSAENYLRRVDAVKKKLRDKQTLGLAPHSIRALPYEWLQEIARYNARAKFPLHMHVQEQPKEIEECKKEYAGKTPFGVLAELGLLQKNFTAVHANHTNSADRKLMAKNKITLCACPTTERDLGDGILEAFDLMDRDIPLALGSDSQTMINLWEDARELEYNLRLKLLTRNVLAKEAAVPLFRAATLNGARSLGIKAGDLHIGNVADFLTLDLNHFSLLGANAKTLLSQAIFSIEPGAIKRIYVGGKKIMENGEHPLREKISREFVSTQKRLARLL